MLSRMIPLLIPFLLSVSACAASTQDYSSQQSGDSDGGAIQIRDEDASAIGSVAFDRAIADLPIITSGEDFDRIQHIMTRLVRSAARPDIGWRMVLVDSNIPDAWVLPDGKMAIYLGILNRLEDDQEIAALLTHQMAHSLLGHNMFLLGRNEIQSVLMAQDTRASGSMREQLAYNLGVSIAEGVQVMPYSRMMESEADDLSMVMMLKAGYDPAAAIGTWQWLSDESRFAMEYLSAHPSVSWRIEQMTDQLPCYHKAFKETWGHNPKGLEEQYRDVTIECPPFVTGLMSNIKRDYSSNNGQEYMYDWDDEPGYEAAYYDHVRYNRYYFDDPYYNAWQRGRVSYSFGFGFGGFSYYRWSPLWSGWSYYSPWRPHYVFRVGRGYNHYVDHPYRYTRSWSHRSLTFRDRHYDRKHYSRDESRYSERRQEYRKYEQREAALRSRNAVIRTQHNSPTPRGKVIQRERQDAAPRNREAVIRTQHNSPRPQGVVTQSEGGKRIITSGRDKVIRSNKNIRQRNVEAARSQIQTKGTKIYRATSKDAAIKRAVKARSVTKRRGVMEFREQTQKQPVRVERSKGAKTKSYSAPKRQVQQKAARANPSYKPRQTKQSPAQERVQQSGSSKPVVIKKKSQKQPSKQSYKAPKPPKQESSKSSDKSSNQVGKKSRYLKSIRERGR